MTSGTTANPANSPDPVSPQERDYRSRMATVRNLERAGQADYDGKAATEKMRQSAWNTWLERAGGDPVKAQRLKTAAMLRGRWGKKASK